MKENRDLNASETSKTSDEIRAVSARRAADMQGNPPAPMAEDMRQNLLLSMTGVIPPGDTLVPPIRLETVTYDFTNCKDLVRPNEVVQKIVVSRRKDLAPPANGSD